MKGPRTPLVSAGRAYDGGTSCGFLLIEAHLPDRTEPVRLWLDTGANVSFLFKLSDYLFRRLERSQPLQGFGGNAAQTSYLALPAQDMEIGSSRLHDVPFYTPAIKQKNLQVSEFDGLLSTWLFRRVFIDHADHFAVLERGRDDGTPPAVLFYSANRVTQTGLTMSDCASARNGVMFHNLGRDRALFVTGTTPPYWRP